MKSNEHEGAGSRAPGVAGSREGSTRSVAVVATAVGAAILSIFGVKEWSLAQPSSRSEVAKAVSRLEPACRPIAQIRFREKLVREGRPLTRREVGKLSSGIEDCEVIDEQMAGLKDG